MGREEREWEINNSGRSERMFGGRKREKRERCQLSGFIGLKPLSSLLPLVFFFSPIMQSSQRFCCCSLITGMSILCVIEVRCLSLLLRDSGILYMHGP